MRFDDPQPAVIVGRHRNRLDHIGFAGEEGDVKAVGHGHLGGRLVRRQGSVPGERGGGEQNQGEQTDDVATHGGWSPGACG